MTPDRRARRPAIRVGLRVGLIPRQPAQPRPPAPHRVAAAPRVLRAPRRCSRQRTGTAAAGVPAPWRCERRGIAAAEPNRRLPASRRKHRRPWRHGSERVIGPRFRARALVRAWTWHRPARGQADGHVDLDSLIERSSSVALPRHHAAAITAAAARAASLQRPAVAAVAAASRSACAQSAATCPPPPRVPSPRLVRSCQLG